MVEQLLLIVKLQLQSKSVKFLQQEIVEQSKKDGKDQETIKSSTISDQGYQLIVKLQLQSKSVKFQHQEIVEQLQLIVKLQLQPKSVKIQK